MREVGQLDDLGVVEVFAQSLDQFGGDVHRGAAHAFGVPQDELVHLAEQRTGLVLR